MLREVMVLKLYENAKLPIRKHSTDSGMDLFYYDSLFLRAGGALVEAHNYIILETGISVCVPEGYTGQIWPKSRSNFLVGGGIVDAGYMGQILVKIFNPTDEDIIIKDGDAIAQLVILPVETPEVKEVTSEEFNSIKSERGANGGILTQVSTATWLEEEGVPDPSITKYGSLDLEDTQW
jgi:dUTP pyrophosphatase